MVLVRVFVNPNVTVPPMKGDQLIGKLRLKAGENHVDSEEWERVKKMPLVQKKIETGLILDAGSVIVSAQPAIVSPLIQQQPQLQDLTPLSQKETKDLASNPTPVSQTMQLSPDQPTTKKKKEVVSDPVSAPVSISSSV